MTLPDLHADPDALALLVAIDAGEDDCLPILADLLEEMGDPRATGLRRLRDAKEPDGCEQIAPFAGADSSPYGWTRHGAAVSDAARHWPHAIRISVFERIQGGSERRHQSIAEKRFPSRSAAFLALAEALAEAD